MAKEKKSEKTVNSKKDSKATSDLFTAHKTRRKKINKYVFRISWPLWLLIMLPMYLPNKCAAFFEPVLKASFECPPISLAISLILGSLFMAFLTWLLSVVVTFLYFYGKELTWKNLNEWFDE
jgi:hypothetical protein